VNPVQHALQGLLPHAPPLLIIDSLVRVSDEACVTTTLVNPDSWYAQPDGSMPAWFGLELMAQTAAVFIGHLALGRGSDPAIGYLLGTRSYTASVPSFPSGAQLEVEAVILQRSIFNQSAMTCEIRHGGTLVASAILKFFEQP
jgi:predicted hotdog family 3-hydroxylacyl-ACP dehydratase